MKPVERRILAADGWSLSALDFEPSGSPRAVAVVGHAMMVDRRTVASAHRPSLATALVQQGFRVLAVDLRGHGASGPTARDGGQWTYDDLVADTAHWLDLARDIANGLPIVWLGHSLFGHVSLAWFGQHPDDAPTAFVGMAVNVWNRRWEPDRRVWWLKRAVSSAANLLVHLQGRMPARAIRMGSADEAAGYWRDMGRFIRDDAWISRQGVDYHAGLRQIGMPALCIVSDGDTWFTRPEEGLAFAAPLPNRECVRLGKSCQISSLDGLAPTHMGFVTEQTSAPIWQFAADWLLGRVPL